MKKIKEIVLLLVIVAGGYGLGQLVLEGYKSYQGSESESFSLDEVLGPKKVLDEEDKSTYMRQHNLALDMHSQGQMQKAVDACEQMMKLNAWNPEGYKLYADVALDYYMMRLNTNQIKNEDVKLKEITQAILIASRLEPDSMDMIKLQTKRYVFMAGLAKEKKNKEEADKHFSSARKFVEKAIAKQGFTISLAMTDINLTLMEEKFDKALADIEKALAMEGAEKYEVNLYVFQAKAYVGKADINSADKSFTKALESKTITTALRFVVLGKRMAFYKDNDLLPMARKDLIYMLELRPGNKALEEAIKKIEKLINGEETGNDSQNVGQNTAGG